ncbi:AAA family ATPase [Janthinobacterium sp. 64]|uniref:AAA family ATPase n=1 Tax=Janthinobacterium sp. 64 TaxID=2035208 RepID=UPI000CBFFCC6|nr:AAA family ATPase [Janthinobacterium sp. 64]PKB13811.1 DNA helicase-2/ATP-dependent DNA helicase PcrA [Janthinobacterium sp. 64]
MAEPEIDIFSQKKVSVMAPAGCGKTELITASLKHGAASKPALVLTHTNAGRAALEHRLKRAGVTASTARVATLDGWAIRVVQSFPKCSGLADRTLRVQGATADYVGIRAAALEILLAGHVSSIIQATYSRVIVDEYQDCGIPQHGMVLALANLLPTAVLGDSLQAIFNFAGPVVDWATHVTPNFPALPSLQIPWRWKRAGAPELGDWLLEVVRPALHTGQPIDLTHAPAQVEWVQLKGSPNEFPEQRLAAAKKRYANASVLLIADSANKQSQWDAAARGRAHMVEALDMKDFVEFSARFDALAEDALEKTIAFAASLMSGLSPQDLVKRTRSLESGRARTQPTHLEALALQFCIKPSFGAAAELLEKFGKSPEIYIYRPDVARLCIKALRAANTGLTFQAAAIRERERFRHIGRTMPNRAVGSTLLLKGLESDIAVILEPERMNARHLYVAMTRGSKKLVICSRQPVLIPSTRS